MGLALKHKERIQQANKEKSGQNFDLAAVNKSIVRRKPLKPNGALNEALQKLKDSFSGDQQTLKLLNGDEQRTPFKIELIEKYRPLCEHFMQNYENWAQLDSLFWWLIWRSDVESFDQIIVDCLKAVEHGLTTPIDFSRDWSAYYADLVFNYYDNLLKDENSDIDDCYVVELINRVVNGDVIINAPLKAKVYAIFGKILMLQNNLSEAIKAFKAALALNEQVGVKTLLKKILTEQEQENSHVEE